MNTLICIRGDIFKVIHSICTIITFQYVQTDPPTTKSLATLIVQLLQFQEDNLGKNVSKPPMTRVPVSSFQ